MALRTQEEARTLQLRKYEGGPGFLHGNLPTKMPESPSEWFSKEFPEQAKVYGAPILEQRYESIDSFGTTTRIKPIALNNDFFAAILGGSPSLGHKVIYYAPEVTFYFWDHRENCFVPTTDQKIETLLSQYFIKCAEQMKRNVDIDALFVDFRDDKKLKGIIAKAKTILAADSTFFSSATGHKRKVGSHILDANAEPPHRLFIRESVVREPTRILTVNEAYERFGKFCTVRGFTPVERKAFKSLVAEVIREEFGLGIRNDLRDGSGRYQKGWRGISCAIPALEAIQARN